MTLDNVGSFPIPAPRLPKLGGGPGVPYSRSHPWLVPASALIFRFPPADYPLWKNLVGANAVVGHLLIHLLVVVTLCPAKGVIVRFP